MTQQFRVVVAGAGYAGVMAANRIAAARMPGVAVTVINPRAEFVERIRLHQYAAETRPATIPLGHILRREVTARLGVADVITDGSVVLADGEAVRFDYLVYAVGSSAVGDGFAGAHAYTMALFEDAGRLRARLRGMPPGGAVVVVGGGLTGIETSAEIAERYPALRVRLISSNPVGHGLPQRSRATIETTLSRLGVTITAGSAVTRVGPDGVELADGCTVPSDCTVWAASFAVPELARRSGLPVDEHGRLRTDETLVCIGHPRIVGVGDAAAPPCGIAGHLRMSCQAALPLGAHGADTVLALLRGRAPRQLSVCMSGQCISLGRRRGLIQIARRDDSPRRLALRGRLAARVKESVSTSTITQLRRARPSYQWLPGPQPPVRTRQAASE